MNIKHIIITATLLFVSIANNAQNKKSIIDSLVNEVKKEVKKNDTLSLRKTLFAIEQQGPKASEIGHLYQENMQSIDQLMGMDYVHNQLQAAIAREYIDPLMSVNSKPDWTALEKKLKQQYSKSYEKPFVVGKLNFALRNNDVKQIADAGEVVRKKFPALLDAMFLNNTAYEALFKKSHEQEILKIALQWSDASILAVPKMATYYDTNANILYKLGRKEEALAKIQRAIELAEPGEKAEFQANLEKMKKGLPTW